MHSIAIRKISQTNRAQMWQKPVDSLGEFSSSGSETSSAHCKRNCNGRFQFHSVHSILYIMLKFILVLSGLIFIFKPETILAQQLSFLGGSARLCVTFGDYNECLQMSKLTNGTLTCVKARDRYECMKHIIDEKADIVNLNNEELYLAGRLYNLEPFAMEQYNGALQISGDHQQQGQYKFNSRSQRQEKLSWLIQFNSWLAYTNRPLTCNSHDGARLSWRTIHSQQVFRPKLRPRSWSSDAYIDAELKKLHPSLCAACQNSTLCSSNDEFAGDDGALKCLFNGYGQVAFTTSKTIERYLSSDRMDRRLLSNYVYLCLDGSKLPLDNKPCEWAHKPTNVFVTAPNRQREKEWYLNFLRQLFFRFVPYKPSWWRMRSLFSDSDHVTQITSVPSHLQQWDKYLGNYISSIEKPLPGCEPNSVTFCTSSTIEELKCLDLQKAAFSQRIRPEIDCKRKNSRLECLDLVARRQADLMSVDLSELYEAPQTIIQQLEPVAVSHGYLDYSVAIVRADSGIKFLYQLAGRRSCHAAFGDLASWLAPISVLSERSLLDQQNCNKADQMAEYFGGSCVPGSADLRINQYRSGAEKLCSICRGDPTGSHQCERSTSERYYGQTGALRCLVEGAGEVAFMSLSSLAANVDGRSTELWARNVPLALDSRNFRLICRNGPNMLLGDYERCHLTRLPGKVLVSTKFTGREDRLTNRRLLTWLVDTFAGESREMFELFGTYQNESDLLFDDSTNRIVTLRLDMSTFDLVSKQHFDPSFQQLPVAHKASNCKVVLTTSSSSTKHPSVLVNLLIFLLQVVAYKLLH